MSRFKRTSGIQFCACGCGGQTLRSRVFPGRWNKFIQGHHVRGDNNPMRRPEIKAKFVGENNCMHNPEVLAKKSGKNHHFYGKKRSKEVCEKISKTKADHPYHHTDEWKEENSRRMKALGNKHPFRNPELIELNRKRSSELKKGIPHSEKTRKRISEALCSLGKNHWMKRPEQRKRAKKFLALVRPDNTGPNHPMWKGGIAAEPYCDIWLDQEYKKDILRRDNCECQNPDCWKTAEGLCGHHIDYDKKNCNPWNVITLCVSCNSRANKDREFWTEFYQGIMSDKHGYKYELEKTG